MRLKRFVGFGFGAIQSGLMLYEAMASGNFESYVLAEVDQEIVDNIRRNGNKAVVNIARSDRIDQATLEGLEIYNPTIAADRDQLARAVNRADEMATAIPSVGLYCAGGESSIAALLAENVDPGRDQVLYASENNNFAAELLRESLLERTGESRLKRLHLLNTVIGKMSGVIQDPSEMAELDLAPMTPDSDRAILVEEFNRILISRCHLTDCERGIRVLQEKHDLLPFEEAKLFGHNAIHALLGYLAHEKGYRAMSEIRNDGGLMDLGRRALLEECGRTIIKKHGAAVDDALFTEQGWAEYAEDLLMRMTNPFLHDRVARICRDPARNLGYGDRLFGTMRECLSQGITPRLLARGALAGIRYLIQERVSPGVQYSGSAHDPDESGIAAMLNELWQNEVPDPRREECLALLQQAAGRHEK